MAKDNDSQEYRDGLVAMALRALRDGKVLELRTMKGPVTLRRVDTDDTCLLTMSPGFETFGSYDKVPLVDGVALALTRYGSVEFARALVLLAT